MCMALTSTIAVVDAARAHLLRHLIRDIEDLLAPLGLEPEVVGVGSHELR